jgi:hypothetical protein
MCSSRFRDAVAYLISSVSVIKLVVYCLNDNGLDIIMMMIRFINNGLDLGFSVVYLSSDDVYLIRNGLDLTTTYNHLTNE